MKTKAQKIESVDALAKQLPDASITVFTTFARHGEKGLSVSQLEQLKRALRSHESSEYVVTKKTLVEKAMGKLNYDGVDLYAMDGSMGIVLGHGDVFVIAKELYKFAKENGALKMFGAWMDGKFVSLAELSDMATLPSRDELLARLMGMLKYPLSSLAIVLGQVAKGKEAASPAPTPAAPAAEPVAEPVAEAAAEPVAEAAPEVAPEAPAAEEVVTQ